MDNVFYVAASGLATLWLIIHTFVGGRETARPLLQAASLEPVVRNTQYLCWHFTTVAIVCMAGLFLFAGFTGIDAYATSATLLASGFFVAGVAIAFTLRENHIRLPQGWLFLPVAGLGVAGHVL